MPQGQCYRQEQGKTKRDPKQDRHSVFRQICFQVGCANFANGRDTRCRRPQKGFPFSLGAPGGFQLNYKVARELSINVFKPDTYGRSRFAAIGAE